MPEMKARARSYPRVNLRAEQQKIIPLPASSRIGINSISLFVVTFNQGLLTTRNPLRSVSPRISTFGFALPGGMQGKGSYQHSL